MSHRKPRATPVTDPTADDHDEVDVVELAYEAEQQTYRVKALIHQLAEAEDDDSDLKYCLEGVERLLEPTCSQLSSLVWELRK